MAIHEQTPEQTTPTRPTSERATEAQAYFARPEILDIARNAIRHELGEKGVLHFETILAIARPPTDDDVAEALAAYQKTNLPGNIYAGQKEHQLRNIRSGDPTFVGTVVAAIVRHFLGR